MDALYPNLPQNKILRGLCVGLFVGMFIVYGVLLSRLLDPQFVMPDSVRAVAWGPIDLERAMRIGLRGSYRVYGELEDLDSAFRLIGKMKTPVSVMIDLTTHGRLLVTDDIVKISYDVARTPGQLKKAVLKSWLLQQTARPHLYADSADSSQPSSTLSHLQLDVVSDVLVSFLEDDEPLQTLSGVPLTLPSAQNWLSFASSFDHYCESRWASLELAPLCLEILKKKNDRNLTDLAYRPLMASLVSQVLQTSSMTGRWSEIARWLDVLKSRDVNTADTIGGVKKDLNEERDRLRESVVALLPQSLNKEQRAQLSASLSDARLLVSQPARSDVVLQIGEMKFLPGQMEISAQDLPAELGVWSACEPPRMKDVIKNFGQVHRFIFVQECGSSHITNFNFARVDMRVFAKLNPTIPFVVLNLEPTKWALAHGLMNENMRVSELTKQTDSPYWGLKTAELDRGVGAYKVLGAVEAIAWFRNAKPKAADASAL